MPNLRLDFHACMLDTEAVIVKLIIYSTRLKVKDDINLGNLFKNI